MIQSLIISLVFTTSDKKGKGGQRNGAVKAATTLSLLAAASGDMCNIDKVIELNNIDYCPDDSPGPLGEVCENYFDTPFALSRGYELLEQIECEFGFGKGDISRGQLKSYHGVSCVYDGSGHACIRDTTCKGKYSMAWYATKKLYQQRKNINKCKKF